MRKVVRCMLNSCAGVGNIELLETIIPCHEVFPRGGGASCQTAAELYHWVFGGEHSIHYDGPADCG